jgi:hypothetical protein
MVVLGTTMTEEEEKASLRTTRSVP